MKVRIIKKSKLLQEKVEVTVNASKEDQEASKAASKKGDAKYFFTVETDNMKVKQVLTIQENSPGTAKEVFDDQLLKVQSCFPEPPEMTYQGDELDPIHQIQVDNGYVVQTPQYATNTMGQKIYSHDNNYWLLGDKARQRINVWSISFEIVEINDGPLAGYGQEYSTNPFNSLRASYAFFRKLTELVGEFVAKNPYRFYYFHGMQEQGERDEDVSKRTQLYNTMLKKMYKVLGGNWVQFEETYEGYSDPNSIFFFKCPGGTVTESRKRKYYLTSEDKKLIHEAYNSELVNALDEKKKRKKRRKKRKPRAAYWWGYGLHDSDYGDAGDGGGGDGKRDDDLSEDQLDEKKKKKKKAGTESSKETSLHHWFKRKGAKGKKKGWVDCNAPDGKGGYKSCGRSSGEKRKKYPACRPTPGACKERGRGKSWGKKGSKRKKK